MRKPEGAGQTVEHKEHEFRKHERRSRLRLSDLQRMAEDVVRDHMKHEPPKHAGKHGTHGHAEHDNKDR